MADKKISQLDTLTSANAADLIHVVDIAPTPLNKKMTISNLFNPINTDVVISQTTTSTSTSTGSFVTNGGVGIAENLYVGGIATITGNVTLNGTTTTLNSSVTLGSSSGDSITAAATLEGTFKFNASNSELGETAQRINNIYATTLTTTNLSVGSIISNLIPSTDNTISVGSASNRMSAVYANEIAISSGGTITTDTSVGLTICEVASQLLGFYGATPIAQSGAISNANTTNYVSKTNEIITVLRNLGLIAT